MAPISHLTSNSTLAILIRSGHTPTNAVKILPATLRQSIADVNLHLAATGLMSVVTIVTAIGAGVPLLVVGVPVFYGLFERLQLRSNLRRERELMQDPAAIAAMIAAAQDGGEIAAVSTFAQLRTAQDAVAASALPSDAYHEAIHNVGPQPVTPHAAAPPSASPPPSVRQATSDVGAVSGGVDDKLSAYIAATPLATRADAVYKALLDAGVPLVMLRHHCNLLFYGPSQSGKSTLAHMLMVLRLASGGRGVYTSPHSDHPDVASPQLASVGRNRDFAAIETAVASIVQSEGYQQGRPDSINAFLVLDELVEYRQPEIYGVPKSLADLVYHTLMGNVTKGPKTKTALVMMAQVATISGLNLKGMLTAINGSWIVVEAVLKPADPMSGGVPSPSGSYKVKLPNDTKIMTWTLPKTIDLPTLGNVPLFARNARGYDCPLAGLMRIFPELVPPPQPSPQPSTTPSPQPSTTPSPQPSTTPSPQPSTTPSTKAIDYTKALTASRGYLHVGGDKGGVELLIQTTLPIIAKTRTVNLIKAGDEGVTAYCQAVKPGDNEVFVTWHPVPHELAMAAVQTRTLVIHLTTVAASSADRHTILCDGLNDAGVHAYRWGTNSFTIAPLDSPF